MNYAASALDVHLPRAAIDVPFTRANHFAIATGTSACPPRQGVDG
jgi:hypothetical protein